MFGVTLIDENGAESRTAVIENRRGQEMKHRPGGSCNKTRQFIKLEEYEEKRLINQNILHLEH